MKENKTRKRIAVCRVTIARYNTYKPSVVEGEEERRGIDGSREPCRMLTGDVVREGREGDVRDGGRCREGGRNVGGGPRD